MNARLPSIILLSLLAAGCGSPSGQKEAAPVAAPVATATQPARPPGDEVRPARPEETAKPTGSDELAPFPFTAEQIRAGCPQGRSSLFRHERAGQAPSFQRMEFVRVGELGGTVRSTSYDADRKEAGTVEGESAWEELKAHASYPADRTTVSVVELEVPAGKFKAKLYTVRAPDGAIELRAWFADELPGPPVRMEIFNGGVVASTMMLVENVTPTAS